MSADPSSLSRSSGSGRRVALFACDILLGAAAALGQAPWGLWPVSVAAFALIVWRVATTTSARDGALSSLRAGIGYFALSMFWIIEPFLVEPEIYGWLAPFALTGIAVGGALFWAVPTWLALLPVRGAAMRGVAFAAAIVLSDWLRGWLFTGLPWALGGHIWIDSPVGQIAALAGSIGLSALTMLLALLPNLLRALDNNRMRGLLSGAALSLAVLAGAWAYGSARLSTPLPDTARPQILRLVQPNAEQRLKWDPYWSGVFFQRLIDLSSGPTAEGGRPDVVIWPETAVNFLLEHAGTAPQDIKTAIEAPLLLGIQRVEGNRYFNSFAEFRRDGTIGQIYDKFHLVPFGEYTPWGDAMSRLGISAFAARYGNGYTPGDGAHVLRGLGAGLPPVQVLICYEAVFSRHLITQGAERPEWLLQITNDAWFGTQSGPWQHLAQARLRAIESGLPLIRVANTGVTAVIDARGTIKAQLDLGIEGRLDAALPASLASTPWSKLGDWPAVLLAALALLGAIVGSGLKRNPSAG